MMGTTAILSRTNLGLRPFESALAESGVPYFLVGKCGYWSQSEVRSVLAHLQCCVYPSDYALGTCLRSPFWPTKFLPKTKISARIKELQQDKEPSMWHLMTKESFSLVENKNLEALHNFVQFIGSLSRYKNLTAGEATKQVLSTLRAIDYYHEEEAVDNDPVANLVELAKIASKYQTIKEFLDYARRVTAASKKRSGIALGTCHSVKGLEFKTVYLTGVQEGMLPHAKATDLESERNCFFVGASRAERKLVLSYSGIPSPFLAPFLKPKPEVVV